MQFFAEFYQKFRLGNFIWNAYDVDRSGQRKRDIVEHVQMHIAAVRAFLEEHGKLVTFHATLIRDDTDLIARDAINGATRILDDPMDDVSYHLFQVFVLEHTQKAIVVQKRNHHYHVLAIGTDIAIVVRDEHVAVVNPCHRIGMEIVHFDQEHYAHQGNRFAEKFKF